MDDAAGRGVIENAKLLVLRLNWVAMQDVHNLSPKIVDIEKGLGARAAIEVVDPGHQRH
jgi:hypothetical protein